MSLTLQLFGILFGLGFIGVTVRALVTRRISERQSLFWLFSGVVIVFVCMFPGIAFFIADIFGVDYPPSIIFMVLFLLVIYGLFYCFRKISLLYNQSRDLAIQVSMLNSEVSKLKKELRKLSSDGGRGNV